MPKNWNKKGISMMETLVAVAVFAVSIVVSANILIATVKLEKKSEIQNAVFEDVRAILQALTNEIQNGTLDYDEYYSVCALQEACGSSVPAGNVYYGVYHGFYGSRFFDPGLDDSFLAEDNPDGLGVICSYPIPSNGACDIVYSLSADTNTGENPFAGSSGPAVDSNAFCEDTNNVAQGICSAPGAGNNYIGSDNEKATIEHLFILDETGTEKTILVKKLVRENGAGTADDDYAIGKVVMSGIDTDQNGITDTFTCDDEYICDDTVADLDETVMYDQQILDETGSPVYSDASDFLTTNGYTMPKMSDREAPFIDGSGDIDPDSQFIPITPLRVSVDELKFIISPVEDPYKAFSENAQQAHPTVTIVMTLDLAEPVKENYPGNFDPITVQTTVSAGVFSRIDTYPSVSHVRDPGDLHWMAACDGGVAAPNCNLEPTAP